MSDKPLAMNMAFQREYAERYDWLKKFFAHWALILVYKSRVKNGKGEKGDE